MLRALVSCRRMTHLPPAHTMLTPLEIEIPPCHLAEVISAQTSSANVRPHGIDHSSFVIDICVRDSIETLLSNENRGHSNEQHAPQGSI